MTLQLNDIVLSFTKQELVELGISIADGTVEYEQILKWIEAHIKR